MTRHMTYSLVVLSSLLVAVNSQYSYDKPVKLIDDGYAYAKPAATGHFFPPLPTVKPLPAVPDLPPLPTARPKVTLTQQALYQTHPTPGHGAPHTTLLPATFKPTDIDKIAQQYRPSSAPTSTGGTSGYGVTGSGNGGSYSQPTAPSGGGEILLGTFGPPTGSAALDPNAPAQQPLRIPFGKTAIIHPAGTGGGERPLKQYSVIEIIDNDIAQNNQPFLPPLVHDDFRALIGATGTGAIAPLTTGFQFESKANSNVVAQQQQQEYHTSFRSSGQIALGSGGLGLVRLPDGKIHLGSGSLGYISNDMVRHNANEARTRSEMARASALHFGHGSLAQAQQQQFGGARTFRF
ncbi:uncharacterized protein LOC101893121 [Musca domestica]|uniref:Uncharacterized protein LOC101893121 n=1 Tax=Musca domestica TaxID=7370 RepID=A0A1I8M9E4_MUSDO|nr:uncharacterized protein LOC101893121 [Musca domestica]XP_005175940.1 uncharacterized protein LOC101893121 [Musca domestica]